MRHHGYNFAVQYISMVAKLVRRALCASEGVLQVRVLPMLQRKI